MHNDRYHALVQDFMEDTVEEIGVKKGGEYANDEDRLANFKRGAKNLGLEPETVLMVYAAKHWDSINNFVKKVAEARSLAAIERGLSEPIEGRLKDLVNYMLLLNALIHERREDEGGRIERANNVMKESLE